MAKIAHAGKVWAFEPSSSTADLLETSEHANELHNLHVCRVAVSDAVGVAKFLIADEGSEFNHLVGMDNNLAGHGEKTEQVQITTLDECMRKFAWERMDFIKIDAEGAELQIIQGGKQFFEQLSPLVMFEAEHAGVGAGIPLTNALSGLGYSIFRFVPSLCALVEISAEVVADRAAKKADLNLFACKEDCAELLAERCLLIREGTETALTTELMAAGMSAFEELPYVRALAGHWGVGGECQRNEVEVAIALLHMSKDTSRSLGQRYAALFDSYQR